MIHGVNNPKLGNFYQLNYMKKFVDGGVNNWFTFLNPTHCPRRF